MHKKPTGFTIVELLIVIVVIGILAAITIVAYNGVQNKANDAAIKSDLAAASKKLAIFYVDKDRYPKDSAELDTAGIKVSQSAYDTNRVLNFSYCRNADFSDYAIGGIGKSGKQFAITSTKGVYEYAATLVNDGNRADLGTSCTDLVAGGTRMQAGFYNADLTTGPWRFWTKG